MTRQARRGHGFERRKQRRPQCERLEPRALLATIVVTGTGDTVAADGLVTLREAITAANNNAVSGDAPAGDPGMDTIDFDIPGAGPHTISVSSNLPAITEPVTIDGYSPLENGSSKNTLAVGDNAKLQVEVVGGPSVSGGLLTVNAGANGCIIQGLVLRGGQNQISIFSDGNVVQGNFLGTDASGNSAPAGTSALDAILIYQGTGNRIGGTDPAQRNVIWNGNGGGGIRLGNSFFLDYLPVNTLIQGNYIGVNADGTAALSTSGGQGIFIDQARGTTIGGPAPGAGNVISGHMYGIMVQSGSTELGVGDQNGDLTIQGNYIGTNATGTEAIPNRVNGIAWFDGQPMSNRPAATLTIGGTNPGEGNLISGNGHGVQSDIIRTNSEPLVDGGIRINFVNNPAHNSGELPDRLAIIQGNLIGTQADGISPLPNQGFGVKVATDPFDEATIGPSDPYSEEEEEEEEEATAPREDGFIDGFDPNQSGSLTAGGNVIAFNAGLGVVVLDNDDSTPQVSNSVSILSNLIHDNGELGISLGGSNTPVPNDLNPDDPFENDSDTGPNDLQNYPVLHSAVTSDGHTKITGTLSSLSDGSFDVQLFADSPAGTPPQSAQHLLLGTLDVYIDPEVGDGGSADFSFSTDTPLADGLVVTATATQAGRLQTSEFSPSGVVVSSGQQAPSTDLGVSIKRNFTSLSPGSTADYTVTVENVSEGTATGAQLVISLPGNADFKSFSTSDMPVNGVLTVAVGDLAAGGQKTYHLKLSPKAGSAGQSVDLSARVSTTATDNDTDRTSNPVTAPAVAHGDLSIQGPVSVSESAGGATVTIVRTGGSSGTVQATFQTSGGSAAPGQDYQPVSQTVTFHDGETSKTVMVPVLDNHIVGGEKTVGLVLTDISGTDHPNARPSSTLTIKDDDTNPSGPPPPVPVTVSNLVRYGYHMQPTLLVLNLSGPVASTALAGDPSLYSVFRLGRGGRLGPRLGRALPISSATYNPASNSILLRPSRLLSMHARYRLVANLGALTDTSGHPLRGNAGGLYATTFGPEILAGANLSVSGRHLASALRVRAQTLHSRRWTR